MADLSSEEFAFLARRLGYDDRTSHLEGDMAEHSRFVRDASARLLG